MGLLHHVQGIVPNKRLEIDRAFDTEARARGSSFRMSHLRAV
jgi:hypothetical protein